MTTTDRLYVVRYWHRGGFIAEAKVHATDAHAARRLLTTVVDPATVSRVVSATRA